MQERFNISLNPGDLGARPVHRYVPWQETPEDGLEVRVVGTETGERVDKVYGPPPDLRHRRM